MALKLILGNINKYKCISNLTQSLIDKIFRNLRYITQEVFRKPL
ncbi:MAG: hypothetical protein ACQZ3N_02525 [cyanobacterium endosymbiont of Rhopalodia yunnanensis]